MEQNQSSAPRLHPPNTLYNTDGWRRTRKSTSKITVRSAKKQERLKKHGTQNQSATGLDLETPWLPSLLTQDVTTCTRLSAASQGSPTFSSTPPSGGQRLLTNTDDPLTSKNWVRSALRWIRRSKGACEGRLRWVCCKLWVCSSQRDVKQGVLVIIMARRGNVCGSVLLQFYSEYMWNLISFKLLFTTDSDGMFWSFWENETRAGGREDVCGGRPVRTHYYTNTGTSTEVLHRYVQSNQATHWNTE